MNTIFSGYASFFLFLCLNNITKIFRKLFHLCKQNQIINTMTRNLLLFWGILILLVSACHNVANESSAKKNDTVTITVASFDTSAYNYIDQAVKIEGTVLHTCKHGGKRMFLIDGTDSIRVEITAGPDITKFDESLIGSKIRVFGILKKERIDAKYLNEWEAEVKKPSENHNVGVHTGAKGHEDQVTEDKLAQINALREDLKKSGKDHLSFYSIEATSFIDIK